MENDLLTTEIQRLETLGDVFNLILPTVSDDCEQFRVLKGRFSGTRTSKFKLEQKAGCTWKFKVSVLSEWGAETWNLKFKATGTGCCYFSCITPKAEVTVLDELEANKEIIKIAYDNDGCCTCFRHGGERMIEIFALGLTDPIGRITYDSSTGFLNSATMSNLVTTQHFKMKSTTNDSFSPVMPTMQVHNLLGIPVAGAGVTRLFTHKGSTTFKDFEIHFDSSMSVTTKTLMLALVILWAMDLRKTQIRSNLCGFFLGIIISFTIAGIIIACTT